MSPTDLPIPATPPTGDLVVLQEAILANSPDLAVVVDDAGTITFCGPNLARVLGHRVDDVVGGHLTDFVHPDDRTRAALHFAQRVAGHHSDDSLAVRVRHADGRHLLMEPLVVDARDVPGVSGHIVAIRDVTERARAQRIAEHAMAHASGFVLVLDAAGEVTWTSGDVAPYIGEMRSLTKALAMGMFESASAPQTPGQLFAEVVTAGPGARAHATGRLGPPGRPKRWVDVIAHNALDDPSVNGIIVSIRDVEDVIATAQSQNRLSQVVEETSDLVMLFDRDMNLVWANAAATAELGASTLTAQQISSITPRSTFDIVVEVILPHLRDHDSWRGEVEMGLHDGSTVSVDSTFLVHRDPAGSVEFISTISRDMSVRKDLESRLRHEARHDALTGLPNRVVLMERLARAHGDGEAVALAFVDIDHFKEINDTTGHETGDEVLVAMAERLRGAGHRGDLVTRFGGDEFAVVFGDVSDRAHALDRADDLLRAVRGPVRSGGLDVYITASVGVAHGDVGPSDLVARADGAMYAAKRSGRDQVMGFREEIRTETTRRMTILHDLRRGIDDHEIVAWFQPIVAAADGQVNTVESLVRWQHPHRGLLGPGAFLDEAEGAGLSSVIGQSVLSQTVAMLRRRLDEGRHLRASVNLSVHQLADHGFVDEVIDTLRKGGVAASQLTFEVTEGAMLRDLARATRTLGGLRTLGAQVALDDFGTGYSSLAYLRRLPVDQLKIDRQFIIDLTVEASGQPIAQAIVGLGHSMGLQVVAEGVEQHDQADILRTMGCDFLQGYLFSPAVPLCEVDDLLGGFAIGGPGA